MTELLVSEVFQSIQGEGVNTGKPTIFVRLSGCNLQCEFCDTKYHSVVGMRLTTEQLYTRILDMSLNSGCKDVCITGGEPLLQNISLLTCMLQVAGFYVSIETNGTQVLPLDIHVDNLTVSPKLSRSPECIIEQADEVKILVFPSGIDYKSQEWLTSYLPLLRRDVALCLQPVSNSQAAINYILQMLTSPQFSNWRLSVQIHKFIGVR